MTAPTQGGASTQGRGHAGGVDLQTALRKRAAHVRAATEALCRGLCTEDYVLQSMPDASPAKWHLAHTSWFFETFVFCAHVPGYRPYRAGWDFLFNSYYEAVGPRHPRAQRGLLSRPTVDEIYAYRSAVNAQLGELLASARPLPDAVLALIELGLQHEQQHQELLLTDLQHGLACNPLRPALDGRPAPEAAAMPAAQPLGWIEREGGLSALGRAPVAAPAAGASQLDFAFDNETPRHRVYLQPFALASRPVTCGEFANFIADDGYRRPELWLSDGWSTVCAEGWQAPLYWERRDERWWRYSLHGMTAVDAHAPVAHVSYFEADAFARWRGARLPSEAEWEAVAAELPIDGQFVEDGALVPLPRPQQRGLCGGTWIWTRSAYAQYPGYVQPEGAIGEYNAKFMINQMVLRGGSCFTAAEHTRATYRNFFPPSARWQVSGIRLARDL